MTLLLLDLLPWALLDVLVVVVAVSSATLPSVASGDRQSH